MSILTSPYMQTGNAHLLPIDRNDPTLGLYLPLWYPHGDISGSSPLSYDRNRHACTATGTTWGIQGRTFVAASLDRIQVGIVGSTGLTGVTDTTILVWAYPTSLATENKSIISKNNVNTENRYDIFFQTDGSVYFYYENHNTACGAPTGAGICTINNWYFLSFRFGSGGVKGEVNLANQITDANTGVMEAEGVGATAVYLGRDYNNDLEFDGIIGDVMIFTRYLSDGEIANTKQATQWRYQ